MSYQILLSAVRHKKCVTFWHGGHQRRGSPHAIGRDNDGDLHVLVFQYGGTSRSGLPAGGMWRCFKVSDISGANENDDSWRTASDHSRPNTCVTHPDAIAY